MESEAIGPVDFREAQHKQWDSAAVGWEGVERELSTTQNSASVPPPSK